ncbi:MAG: hypothetical protein AABX32_05190 [Nanoarchaeota archaeon]
MPPKLSQRKDKSFVEEALRSKLFWIVIPSIVIMLSFSFIYETFDPMLFLFPLVIPILWMIGLASFFDIKNVALINPITYFVYSALFYFGVYKFLKQIKTIRLRFLYLAIVILVLFLVLTIKGCTIAKDISF